MRNLLRRSYCAPNYVGVGHQTKARHRRHSGASAKASALRHYYSGSEWFYVRVECPEEAQDHFIKETLADFASESCRCGLAHSWFFIRYDVPVPHIRLRFKVAATSKVGALLENVHNWLSSNVWVCGARSRLDTYEREIERFGGEDAVIHCEDLFHHDSVLACDTLQVVKETSGHLSKAIGAVCGLDSILTVMQLPLRSSLALFRRYAIGRTESSESFRMQRRRVEELIGVRSIAPA